jgi:hypothetical protein
LNGLTWTGRGGWVQYPVPVNPSPMLDVHSDVDSMIEQQNQLAWLLFYDNNDESTNHFWHTSNFINQASYQCSPGNTLTIKCLDDLSALDVSRHRHLTIASNTGKK